LQDEDGTVQDLSVYDGDKTVSCKPPMGSKLISATCTFVTDGTDGKLKFSWADGDVDRPGAWAGTVVMNKTNVVAKSYKFTMKVEEAVV